MHSPLQTPPRVHVRLQGPSTPQSIRAASLTPPASCPPFSRRSQCSSQKLQASGLSPCPARGVAVSAQFSNFGTEDAATDAAETLARARREAIDDVIELGPSPQTLQRTAVASGMGVESTPGRSASPFNQSIAITDRAVVAASAVRRSQAPRRGVILDAFANNTPAGGPASSPRASSARTATATRTSSRSTSYRRHGEKLHSLVVEQSQRLPAPWPLLPTLSPSCCSACCSQAAGLPHLAPVRAQRPATALLRARRLLGHTQPAHARDGDQPAHSVRQGGGWPQAAGPASGANNAILAGQHRTTAPKSFPTCPIVDACLNQNPCLMRITWTPRDGCVPVSPLAQRVRVLCPAIDPDSLASEAEARNVLKRHATDELGFLQVRSLCCCFCSCCLPCVDTARVPHSCAFPACCTRRLSRPCVGISLKACCPPRPQPPPPPSQFFNVYRTNAAIARVSPPASISLGWVLDMPEQPPIPIVDACTTPPPCQVSAIAARTMHSQRRGHLRS